MMLPIALSAAGAGALVNFWLAWRIAQVRDAENIWVGDGGNIRLGKGVVRGHVLGGKGTRTWW
jgi:hypothetical protein